MFEVSSKQIGREKTDSTIISCLASTMNKDESTDVILLSQVAVARDFRYYKDYPPVTTSTPLNQ